MNPNLDEIFGEVEQKFRQGADQAREAIRRQPGAALAGVAVLGFVTGLLVRKFASRQERGNGSS